MKPKKEIKETKFESEGDRLQYDIQFLELINESSFYDSLNVEEHRNKNEIISVGELSKILRKCPYSKTNIVRLYMNTFFQDINFHYDLAERAITKEDCLKLALESVENIFDPIKHDNPCHEYIKWTISNIVDIKHRCSRVTPPDDFLINVNKALTKYNEIQDKYHIPLFEIPYYKTAEFLFDTVIVTSDWGVKEEYKRYIKQEGKLPNFVYVDHLLKTTHFKDNVDVQKLTHPDNIHKTTDKLNDYFSSFLQPPVVENEKTPDQLETEINQHINKANEILNINIPPFNPKGTKPMSVITLTPEESNKAVGCVKTIFGVKASDVTESMYLDHIRRLESEIKELESIDTASTKVAKSIKDLKAQLDSLVKAYDKS